MTLDDVCAKWLGSEGGAERANYQMFLTVLAMALGLPTPDAKGQGIGDYEFEAPVRSEAVYGGGGTKRIDLYKRGCFILEAKQSQLKPGEAAPDEGEAAEPGETLFDLFGNPIGTAPSKAKPRRRYDRLMEDARLQAQRYALALPEDHPTPPFLIVADIGRAFELYFDWAGNGRGYRPFPDERGYRITLSDLAANTPVEGADLGAADLLRAIWTEPGSVDPRTKAARVTREVAERLSRVAENLERTQRLRGVAAAEHEIALGIEETSLFVMRLLFCMFAEDVGLLPKNSFSTFLAEARDVAKADAAAAHQYWRAGLEELWSMMARGGEPRPYWLLGKGLIRHFNGNLFVKRTVYPLEEEYIGELKVAAEKEWKDVEPAIFGTLLEQVLTTSERAKLGAHYTPRAYVERLVQAVVMDVLTPEWEAVKAAARALVEGGEKKEGRASTSSAKPEFGGSSPYEAEEGRASTSSAKPEFGGSSKHSTGFPELVEGFSFPSPLSGAQAAIALACDFHERLANLRILDPACGTGNFLYVAMEALLRLESEVRQFVIALGGTLEPRVHPNQFLGLELNPRAAVIAELVLWIGWLRFRLANTPEVVGGKDGGEPVLPPLSNINGGTHGGLDAVLVRTATGEPDAANPRRPEWPEADFIIGNPPFIGGKDIRARLGSDYAEALWAANPRVPKSADFVMHWWDRAAELLTRPGTRLRRFGFVTTNSITQVFSRRVIEGWLANTAPPRSRGGGGGEADDGGGAVADAASQGRARAETPLHRASAVPLPVNGEDQGKLHLVLAIPDHPWTRVGRDAAAVRIAMTVAEAGPGAGKLVEIVSEAGLDTDKPVLGERVDTGAINADLSVGTDVTRVVPLKANEGLCSPGVKLHGAGFIVTPAQARELGLGTRPGLDKHIRDYRNGRDLLQRPRGVMVIDLFGLSEQEVMERFPEVYQHLLKTVREDRAKQVQRSPTNDARAYLRTWWVFGKPRTELRPALAGLPRYIATTETSKHRIFQFVDGATTADNMIVVMASDDPTHLGVLSSAPHCAWALDRGGTLEDRPRWSKSLVYDPFPFPDRSESVAEFAERLDATRRTALAENPSLTMTGLYNLVAAIRSGALPVDQERTATQARAFIVAKLHDDLDAAVAQAYGWDWPLQPPEIVRRLVALNAERAAEEAAGHVRWLRPDYQVPRFGGGGKV
jgi:hypothetical protein